MAAGDATAADVPGRYDVVINGKGYVFADSIEPSLPFRTHRAIYDITPTFVERQNVSNSYGDNAQDFFQTIRQRNWSLGEQQKYYRAGTDGMYWRGSAVDVTIPGQVTLRRAIKQITFTHPNEAIALAPINGATDAIYAASASDLYLIDNTGALTAKGGHGLGAAPSPLGMCSDGNALYFSTTTAGTVGVRRYDGGAFTTFSASGADSLEFLNNTLYGLRNSTGDLVRYDTAGALTSLFTWKDASGTGVSSTSARLRAYGGKLLILRNRGVRNSELWIYDGTSPQRVEDFPASFRAWDMDVVFGIAFISGKFIRKNGGSYEYRPAVLFYDGSTVGVLWQTSGYGGYDYPAVSAFDSGLAFTNDENSSIMFYSPATGGVHSVGAYSVGGASPVMAASQSFLLFTNQLTTGYFFPDPTTTATSGYVQSSLIDFDSSLSKIFRGITVEWSAASDGDGGSVDIAYQIDSLSGSWTALQTGAASGTEYTLAGVTGHAIAIKVTLNKGTSTLGPTVKSVSLRAVPELKQFVSGLYIIDCTASPDAPRELRDGTYHSLVGYDQMKNLVTAAKATAPFSVTDKVNGTFTAVVDLQDSEGFDVYEIHPNPDNPNKPGSYLVRIKLREV